MEKKNSSVTKGVATVKQTSGAGFAFEDKTVAYYLTWMLTGNPPFEIYHGSISRLDCQVKVDGWLLDDLLITTVQKGQEHRYAFSIKSNNQFTSKRARPNFVADSWALFLHEGSDVFNLDLDMMGLICVPQPNSPREALHSLLKKAKDQTSKQLSSRIKNNDYASTIERNLFNSFACPKRLATKNRVDEQFIGELLKRIVVVELDFDRKQSSDEKLAIYLCKELLLDGSIESSVALWDALCQKAQELRTAGGGCTREDLLFELNTQFELREFPDLSMDWHQLRTWCESEMKSVHELIGGKVKIERKELVNNILSTITKANFTALIASSGIGKTVIAKWAAEEFIKSGEILWFDAGYIRPTYVEYFASQHGLEHPLSDVLKNRATSNGLIVIDGIERLREGNDFKEACRLFYILVMDKPGCTWRVLVTCQAEEWERVELGFMQFLEQTIKWDVNLLPALNYQDLLPVWQAFPALHTLVVRPHLTEFIINPKVLDILAKVLQSGIEFDDKTWIGESDIVNWYWKNVVRTGEQGIAKSVLLQHIAEVEADNGNFEFPESKLSPSESILVSNLKGILNVRDDYATITFSHDLFADWARLMALRSHKETFKDYVKDKYKNSHWHKAIRLYGVFLLEEDKTGKIWETCLIEYPEIHNFLLEAVVFTGNSSQLLPNVWPILIDNEGKLLKDFLMRFLYFATYPNPRYMQIAREVGATDIEARTWERLPLWMYWLGILDFLASHIEEVTQFAPIEIGQVAYTWLRYSSSDWPNRNHAAMLALAAAQVIFREGYYSQNYSENEFRYPFKAALEAFVDKPKEVRQFALKACSRILPTEEDGDAFNNFKPSKNLSYNNLDDIHENNTPVGSWNDGPLYRQNELFKKVCFETDALKTIMQADPELAEEIILSLLIEVRLDRENGGYGMAHSLHEPTGLDDESEMLFYPGFYTRGPFSLFLRIDPGHALKLIIRLIDFATEQQIKTQYQTNAEEIGITLPLLSQLRFFQGTVNIYYWYRPIRASSIILSALEAVENWLYECIDKKEPVEERVSFILEKSRSIAFIGMLTEIGRYSPVLFTTVLKPLLLTPEPYYFEISFMRLGGYIFGTPYSLREGQWFFDLARKWDSMQHRKIRLINIARFYFHNSSDLREDLIKATIEWQKLIIKNDPSIASFIQELIANFDPKNWTRTELADKSESIVFNLPENMKIPQEEQERADKNTLLAFRPFECREKLDKSIPLAIEQVGEYLNQAKELEESKPPKSDSTTSISIDNVVFGTIAVLFYFHRQWLHDNPREETWCINYVMSKLKQRDRWSSADNLGSLTKDTWEYFACEIIPILWAENPKSKELRIITAQLVVATYNNSIEILIRRSFEKRLFLGEYFWKLVNMVWELAEIGYLLRGQPKREKINISRWRRRITCKFVNGRYPNASPKLGKSNIELRPGWYGNTYHSHYQGKKEAKIYYQQPKIGIEQIKGFFPNVFLPDQAHSKSECVMFQDFWSEILGLSLMRLRLYDENGQEINAQKVEAELPNDFDYWILDKIGIVIAQLDPDDHSERYWLPLLSLGPRAAHWIERFLTDWFLAVKQSANREKFIYHWQQMLNFCLSSDIWIKHGDINSYRLSSLWLNLIGISNIGDLWSDEDREVIISMRKYFVLAAPHFLHSRHDAERLTLWLGKTSSSPIRVDMLLPLANAYTDRSDYYSQERRLATAIAAYLIIVWEENHQEVYSTPELKDAFEELLHSVIDLHEPLALELQTRISSGPGL